MPPRHLIPWFAALFPLATACVGDQTDEQGASSVAAHQARTDELGTLSVAARQASTADSPAPANSSSVIAAAADVPIVYVRCPRTTAVIDVTGEVVIDGVAQTKTRRMTGVDIYDVLPDVTNFLGGFQARCDLILRAADGTENVLYDCSSTSTKDAACSAMDPAVSFDAKTIAFAVFRGKIVYPGANIHPKVIDPAATNTTGTPTRFPNELLRTTEAQLYFVDVATGELTELPHVENTFDSGPAWLANGRIAFTSTRDGRHRTLLPESGAPGEVAQIYTMDRDGRNVDIASYHGLGGEEHPFQLRDGRVAFSSWQGFGGLAYRHTNGTPNQHTTVDNLFHLFTQNPDGAGVFALFGQHSHPTEKITGLNSAKLASHFLTQTTDGRVWTADYYRANNSGLGNVYGIMPPPPGQEGQLVATPLGDLYVPTDRIRFAPWSNNSDAFSSLLGGAPFTPPGWNDPNPFGGKVSHPAALPNNGLMVSWGKGGCSLIANSSVFAALGKPKPPLTDGNGSGAPMNVIASLGLDVPGCDAGIYRASVIPSKHPSDLIPVVDSRDYHEIMARALVPYSEIYGVDKPAEIPRADLATKDPTLPTGTPFALLGAASITDRETHPVGGIHFAGELQFNLQGTDTIDYTDEALCGIRMLGVLPNRGTEIHKELHDVAGERVVILGEVAVRKKGTGGEPLDPSGHPDTSFLLRMPANTPYLMQGIDCEGRTLNTDQSWQHVRPGEKKTCGGCHVHSKDSRITFDQSLAAAPDFEIAKLGEGIVPLLAGGTGADVQTRTVPGFGLQIEFERDIMPIFANHCTTCHGGTSPSGGLALDRPGVQGPSATSPASTWWCLVRDHNQDCLPAAQRFVTNVGNAGTYFRRPQVTRYVRVLNALGSLLYWKAAGKRTDGRTDDTFTSASAVYDRDIDFGPAHDFQIPAEELGMISRWIDLGAPAGAGELKDTQKPTLSLAAILADGAITELRVGTVDIPSGIDPASLVVCVIGADGNCGPNLAPAAEPAGVVTIPATFDNDDIEIEARVKDLAGNETVIRRTVGWLRNSQQQDPPGDDADEPGDGGCCSSAGLSATGLLGQLGLTLGVLIALGRRRHA